MPRFIITKNRATNARIYEIKIIDYAFPKGMTVDYFVREELHEVHRMHVYAPMITDAAFNLHQNMINGLTGIDLANLLRYGTSHRVKSDYRGGSKLRNLHELCLLDVATNSKLAKPKRSSSGRNINPQLGRSGPRTRSSNIRQTTDDSHSSLGNEDMLDDRSVGSTSRGR